MQPHTKQPESSQIGQINFSYDQLLTTNKKFIQTLISGILTYQTSNTVYPVVVYRTPFFEHESSSKLRGKQDMDMNHQVKTHSGAQWIWQLCCAHPKTTRY